MSADTEEARISLFERARKRPYIYAWIESNCSFIGLSGIGILLAGNVWGLAVMIVGWAVWAVALCVGIVTLGTGMPFILVPWWLVTWYAAYHCALVYNRDLLKRIDRLPADDPVLLRHAAEILSAREKRAQRMAARAAERDAIRRGLAACRRPRRTSR